MVYCSGFKRIGHVSPLPRPGLHRSRTLEGTGTRSPQTKFPVSEPVSRHDGKAVGSHLSAIRTRGSIGGIPK